MSDLKENDGRQDYLRARLETIDGERLVEPFPIQDSSMLSIMARSDALIVRAPHAPRAKAGEPVSILELE
jgi:molybdopterin molybdotransferase